MDQEVCQALRLGGLGCLCFLPTSGTHCLCRQRRMDFWFQGVIQPHTSIRLCCRPLSFSPLLISALGCGREIAIVKRPLVKIKITLLDNATALYPHPRQLRDMPGGCAKGGCPGWRVELPCLALNPSPASYWLYYLITLCLSFLV